MIFYDSIQLLSEMFSRGLPHRCIRSDIIFSVRYKMRVGMTDYYYQLKESDNSKIEESG